jgi:hypothetical protein
MVTTMIRAPTASMAGFRKTSIIPSDEVAPATGSRAWSGLPERPSGRVGGASMVRGPRSGAGRTIRAGRCTSRLTGRTRRRWSEMAFVPIILLRDGRL